MYTYKIKYAFVVAIFLVLALGVFSNIMNHPIDHNEHMYISAGVLIQEHALYKDFAYLQIPYSPILYWTFYKVTGTSHYLLSGRVGLFKYFGRFYYTDTWVGVSIHRISEKIRENIGEIGNDGKVATLSPLFAVEAGLPIYKELATGPFLYRVGDLIPEDKMALTPGTSPERLHDLFEKDPPGAIFVGFEDYLDLPFIEYAEKNNYIKVEEDFNKDTLYVFRDRNQPYP
jgi:hypothetical protein